MRYFSLILLALILTSCLEGDDELFQGKSSVLFLNVYNDAADGVDFRVNDGEWPYGYKPYDLIDTYNSFYSGDVTFSAFPAGSSSGTAIASLSSVLDADMDYTCILTGKEGEGKMILFPDTLRTPPVNKSTVRFLNLSPDISRADVQIVDSAKVISGLEYLTAGYMSLDTGLNVIRAFRAGEEEPVAVLRFRAAPRARYTMYTKGLVSREGKDSLAIRYFTQP